MPSCLNVGVYIIFFQSTFGQEKKIVRLAQPYNKEGRNEHHIEDVMNITLRLLETESK